MPPSRMVWIGVSMTAPLESEWVGGRVLHECAVATDGVALGCVSLSLRCVNTGLGPEGDATGNTALRVRKGTGIEHASPLCSG